MTTETISLLTILRDETQSRDVHARCEAEIERLRKSAIYWPYPASESAIKRPAMSEAERNMLESE